jgi:hypothetical protein
MQFIFFTCCIAKKLEKKMKLFSGYNKIFIFSVDPPKLTFKFKEEILQPGPTVSLKCRATGNPSPEIGKHFLF